MRLLALCLFFFLGGNVLPATGQIVYVRAGATGSGTSWSDATGDLRQALSTSGAGTQVWVAQGTYTPTTCTNCGLSDRDLPFSLPDGVALYGGFLGNETHLDQRDWENQSTILSGDIDGDGTGANNAYTILYLRNASSNTIIDGFTFRDGYAENLNYDVYTRLNSGGAIYNDGSLSGSLSEPVIRNCRFSSHYARGFGAAIMNYGGFGGSCSPRIENCRMEDNEVLGNGGAVFNSGVFGGFTGSHFIGCHFEGNRANDGGAVYNQGAESGDSRVVFEDCTFQSNEATVWGGAIVDFGNKGQCRAVYRNCLFKDNRANLGGGVFNDGRFSGLSNPTIRDCVWEDNWSRLGGGGVYSQGPFSGESNPVFQSCTFTRNDTDASGGALYFNAQEGNSHPELTNCIFESNRAEAYGGGMYNFGKTGSCNPSVTNCLFVRNEAHSAGSIYNYGGVNGQSNPTVTNCTFYENRAMVGPCIYNQAADPTGEVSPLVRNCIFWDNIADSGFGLVFQNGYAQPRISHSLLQVGDCTALNTDPNSSVQCGTALLYAIDPQFVAPELDNLHLSETSPARDQGSNAAINATGVQVDLDSLLRIQNGVVDLGVYEYVDLVYEAPSISQQSGDEQHCAGDSTTLYVVSAGTPPLSYTWQKDGQHLSGATDSTLLLTHLTPADAGQYHCIITSGQNDQVSSQPIQLTVDPLLAVALDLSASTTEICAGGTVRFTATPTHGGPAPQYTWTRNGQALALTGPQIDLDDLLDGDLINCQLTSSETCTQSPSATAEAIAIRVHPLLAADISISTDQTSICAGASLRFTATASEGGSTPVYTWYRNGQAVGVNASVLNLDDLADQDQISCVLQSSETCLLANPVSSNTITVAVTAIPPAPSISIQATSQSVCEGEEVRFVAAYLDAGPDPELQWWLNDNPLNVDTDTLRWSSFNTGDEIRAALISSAPCASEEPVLSAPIVMTVTATPVVTAQLSVSNTQPCEGESVALSLTTENAGTDPEYRWYVNGVQNGVTTAAWTWADPQDGDVVYGWVRSSLECAIEPVGQSDSVEMRVVERVVSTIELTTRSTTICAGEEVLMEAVVENGGSTPQYRWFRNGMDQGLNASEWRTMDLRDGDVVQCELRAAVACPLVDSVRSEPLAFVVRELQEASIGIAAVEQTLCGCTSVPICPWGP